MIDKLMVYRAIQVNTSVCQCVTKSLNNRFLILDTIPNPCLATTGTLEQYHPFAFSTHAFIQCNGDLLYVQPCAAGLTWDQETKVCDIPMSATTPAPITVVVADQPVSYQVASGTELKQTNILPTISFADQSVGGSTGYGSIEEKTLVKTNEER